MRYSQFVNTNVLFKDIKEYHLDLLAIHDIKYSKKLRRNTKNNILSIIKILFSPSLFNKSNFTFIGDNIDNLFFDSTYENYEDKLIVELDNNKYECPVYILSNCITPHRFKKVLTNINNKINIQTLTTYEYSLFEILQIYN